MLFMFCVTKSNDNLIFVKIAIFNHEKSSPKRAAFSFSQATYRGGTHGIRSRSGTEGQSGGLPRPRMTEPRSSRRESNPMLSAMKKALHSKCFFQCYPFLYGTDSISYCGEDAIYHAASAVYHIAQRHIILKLDPSNLLPFAGESLPAGTASIASQKKFFNIF